MPACQSASRVVTAAAASTSIGAVPSRTKVAQVDQYTEVAPGVGTGDEHREPTRRIAKTLGHLDGRLSVIVGRSMPLVEFANHWRRQALSRLEAVQEAVAPCRYAR